jgi:hypothetical protein
MAEGVYRFYVKAAAPDLVEGILVSFFKSKVPLLLVGQIKYRMAACSSIKNVCGAWDIWDLYYTWNEQQDLEHVITFGSLDNDRIEWAQVLAVPLYSIKRVENAEQLMAQVRKVSAVSM